MIFNYYLTVLRFIIILIIFQAFHAKTAEHIIRQRTNTEAILIDLHILSASNTLILTYTMLAVGHDFGAEPAVPIIRIFISGI